MLVRCLAGESPRRAHQKLQPPPSIQKRDREKEKEQAESK
mgnify:CR=1 FL=1